MISIIASFDYQKVIPIAEDDDSAINVFALSMLILVFFVITTLLLLTFWSNEILSILDSKVLKDYKYLIPIGVFFSGFYDVLLQWTYRVRNYGAITRTKVNQSTFSNLFKVFIGLLRVGPMGLIVGHVLGQSAGITTLARLILKNNMLLKKLGFQK